MQRAPATVVILAWNAWSETRACLDTLRPTLGVRDEVVVVDNGSTDETPRALRAYPWVRVAANAENRGFAGGCNQGAAVATRDVLVFLNNDTVLSGRWLDPLVGALDDPQVGAAGPRSNFVSGPQLVPEVGYAGGDRSALRAFVHAWAAEHRGQLSDVDRLVGFCLAIRRELFAGIGGFDEGYEIGGAEDDDLSFRLRASGRRLVIAHESYVHHSGHRTFDANDVDWYGQQERNLERLKRKITAFSAAASSEAQPPSAQPPTLPPPSLPPPTLPPPTLPPIQLDADALVGVALGEHAFVERARAAASAHRLFADARAKPAFLAALTAAPAWDVPVIVADTSRIAPELLEGVDERDAYAFADPEAAPLVSVVIPCSGTVTAQQTVACLHALGRHTDRTLYETIVVDDGSTDGTSQLAALAGPGFRVVRNEVALGVAAARDQGAALAASELVVFLDPATTVEDGWLAPFLAPAYSA